VPPDPPAPPPSGYPEPGYTQPGHGEPGSAPLGYGQPGLGEPGLGESAVAPPGYGTPSGYSPPSAGQPAAGPAGLQNFDPKSVDPLDWAIIAAGAIAFIFSTFNYFTYKVAIATFSQKVSVSAWHGVLAPVATLLAILAAVLLAVHVIVKMQLAFPVRLVVLGAFALASLLLLLALFIIPGNTGGAGVVGFKIDKGHGIGYWVSLLAVLAGTGLSYKRFTDTGGTLPIRG
jgi:hypothetical protein